MIRSPSALVRARHRALIIRRHRAKLEAEVRELRIGVLPDEDVPRVFGDLEFDEDRKP